MIIVIDKITDWNALLREIQSYDYYHTFEYTVLESQRQLSKPLFIAFEEGHNLALFPLLIRRIPGTLYYDATSAYGYPGPICRISDSRCLQQFGDELLEYFISQNIISVFTRMNPVLKNQNCLIHLSQSKTVSQTISIILSGTNTEQLAQYRKNNRYFIRKNEKTTCRIVNWREYSEIFMKLYYQTMNRLSADDQYYFSEAYLDQFFQSDSYSPLLVICEFEDQVIGAAIFVGCQGIIQYHLSGSKTGSTKYSPALMMIDHMRKWGSENNYKELHLGGGYSNSDDSLFKFKQGFSDTVYSFSIWRYIVSEEVYFELCRKNGIDLRSTSFFPAYRAPTTLKIED